LWENFLKERPEGYKFLRQKPIGNYILDFYCSELLLAIEIDGGIHKKTEEYDKERDGFLNGCGIKVIRIPNRDVENNFDLVKKAISESINTISSEIKNIPLSSEDKDVLESGGLPLSSEGKSVSDSGGLPLSSEGKNVSDSGGLPLSSEGKNVSDSGGLPLSSEDKDVLDSGGLPLSSEDTNVSDSGGFPLSSEGKNVSDSGGFPLSSEGKNVSDSGGFPLSRGIEGVPEGVYLVNDTEIALILETINTEIIKTVIGIKPQKVITLDRLFHNNDQLKTNTALQMKDAGIEFKVV